MPVLADFMYFFLSFWFIQYWGDSGLFLLKMKNMLLGNMKLYLTISILYLPSHCTWNYWNCLLIVTSQTWLVVLLGLLFWLVIGCNSLSISISYETFYYLFFFWAAGKFQGCTIHYILYFFCVFSWSWSFCSCPKVFKMFVTSQSHLLLMFNFYPLKWWVVNFSLLVWFDDFLHHVYITHLLLIKLLRKFSF